MSLPGGKLCNDAWNINSKNFKRKDRWCVALTMLVVVTNVFSQVNSLVLMILL